MLPSASPADDYFERPQFEHQLPQRSALAMLVDREHRLWIATREGIARWDGSRMRYWQQRPFKPDSLGGNVMRGLLEDRRGDIWAFNNTGFYRRTEPTRLVGPTHEKVRRYPFPGAFLLADADDEVLLAHEGGLYRFDAAANAFDLLLRWGDQTSAVSDALAEPGAIWIATVDGRVRRCRIALSSCREFNTAAVDGKARATALWRDRNGQLNAGLAAAGVARVDEHAETLVRHPDWPRQWSGAMIRDNFRWNGQMVLLTTIGLIWRWNPTQSDCPNRSGDWCRRPVPRGDGPDDATIGSAVVDVHGVLWVGSNWGLRLHDPRAAAFRHWRAGPGGELADGWVLSLAEDAEGAVWAGTFNGRLYRIDPHDASIETRLHLTDSGEGGQFRVIWAIVPTSDRLWLGTNSGLVDFRPDTGKHRVLTPPGGDQRRIEGDGEMRGDPGFVHALAEAGNGALWVGTNGGGLWRFDPATETFARPHTLLNTRAPQWINHLLPEGDALWVASANDGAWRITFNGPPPVQFRHRPDDPSSLASDTVWVQHRDRQGRLWLGTDAGLARLNQQDDGFMHLLDQVELPSVAAMSLSEDAQGRLWIGTNSGLVRLNPETGQIRRFDRSEGLVSIEYNRRAALAASDGTLYFGGDRGIVAINPERVPASIPVPQTRIDALLKAGEDGPRDELLGPGQALVVAPGQAQFGVRLSSTELARPDRLRYQVRLAGLETEWRELVDGAEIFFNRVPPGSYQLESRVIDGAGSLSAVNARSLTVLPTIWQTTWFRALITAAIVAVLIALSARWQQRRDRAQLQALEQRRVLAEERGRISRDMHDEVGSGLSEIALISNAGAAANDSLQRISVRSRELLDAIGAIIWALNPDNDRLDRLLAFLRESTARQCEHFNLDAVFDLPATVPARPVGAGFVRHLGMIVREAVANAGKHAQASRLALSVALDDTGLIVSVEDDGRGFDPESIVATGNGLTNMRTRAAALGGRLEIRAIRGEGTRIRLDLPWSAIKSSPRPDGSKPSPGRRASPRGMYRQTPSTPSQSASIRGG